MIKYSLMFQVTSGDNFRNSDVQKGMNRKEVYQAIRNFKAILETQYGTRLKDESIRSDNEEETTFLREDQHVGDVWVGGVVVKTE